MRVDQIRPGLGQIGKNVEALGDDEALGQLPFLLERRRVDAVESFSVRICIVGGPAQAEDVRKEIYN